ncbi:MAG: hypothetical protein M3Q87_04105, partial [Actinomycetota bacterium]|nr:hypothetical protein [Actinomycetota bacterium]
MNHAELITNALAEVGVEAEITNDDEGLCVFVPRSTDPRLVYRAMRLARLAEGRPVISEDEWAAQEAT